jgi:hypothetical protein
MTPYTSSILGRHLVLEWAEEAEVDLERKLVLGLVVEIKMCPKKKGSWIWVRQERKMMTIWDNCQW